MKKKKPETIKNTENLKKKKYMSHAIFQSYISIKVFYRYFFRKIFLESCIITIQATTKKTSQWNNAFSSSGF